MTAKRTAALLILPGLDGTEVLFRPFLATLPPWVRPTVVIYPTAGPTGYADLLTLVRAKAADLPDQYYVLGSSFSGPLAVMLAAAEPSRVRGLILAATFLRAPLACLPALRFAMLGPLIWSIRTARRLPLWTLRRRNDPFRQAKAEVWRRVSAKCLAARVRAVARVDVRQTFQQGSGPVLCLTFAGDKVVPRRNTEEMVQCRPNIQSITIPGDHFAMWKTPLLWTEAIIGFMRRTDSRCL